MTPITIFTNKDAVTKDYLDGQVGKVLPKREELSVLFCRVPVCRFEQFEFCQPHRFVCERVESFEPRFVACEPRFEVFEPRCHEEFTERFVNNNCFDWNRHDDWGRFGHRV